MGNWLEIQQAYSILNSGANNHSSAGSISDFIEVTLALASQMLVLGGIAKDVREGWSLAAGKLADGSALAKFREMVREQGGDLSIFEEEITPEHRWRLECIRQRFVTASRSGCMGASTHSK